MSVPFPFRAGIPYYLQIKEDLLRRVSGGEFPPEAQLPPELQLADEYGVSRPTVRQAVMELVQEGVLTRRRGKGTFAARPLITSDAGVFQGFAEEMSGRGIAHAARLIGCAQVAATETMARELRIAPGEPVFEVARLRIGDGEPLVLRTLQIPARLCPDLPGKNLAEAPLYGILREDYGLVATGSVQSFWAVAASEEEAALLNVDPGDPLLLWRGVVCAAHGEPIARTRALYRGDRYRFAIRQGSMARPGRPSSLEMVSVR